jgi:hypothetical protein
MEKCYLSPHVPIMGCRECAIWFEDGGLQRVPIFSTGKSLACIGQGGGEGPGFFCIDTEIIILE